MDSRDVSRFDCPHCGGEIEFDVKAAIPDSQTITVSVKSDSSLMVGAELVSGVIAETSKTLIGVAESMDQKVAVFVKDIRVKPGSVDIDLTVGFVA